VYDASVYRVAIVCVVLAGAARAMAQAPDASPMAAGSTVADPAPAPAAAPIPASEPTAPAAAARPSAPPVPGESGQRARERAEELCAARDPRCDWLATLSSFEGASMRRALVARGYELEPSPWGKVIDAIRVYNEEVFAEGAGFLRFFNRLHVTTKEATTRAEAVMMPGERWSQERSEETARRLRDPLWTSVVAVVPIKSAIAGKVDVLIVTRDLWSLRLNTQYTYQQAKLTNLSITFAENNFLGRRDVLAAGVTMDQGAIAVGPLFIDKNLAGAHLDLRVRVDVILTRDDLTLRSKLHSEGTQSTISLSRPLWSLAKEWAAGAAFVHRFAIDRQYRGTQLRTADYVDPATGAITAFERQYAMRRWSASAYVTRQWGSELKHQLSFGHSVSSQRPRPLDTFTGTAEQRAAFVADVLPRSEVTSVPFLEYALFTPRYRTLRDVATFDLAEDLRTGPDLSATIGFGLQLLGSDENFQRLSSSLGWTFPWARDGFARVAAGLGGRLQAGELIDNTATVSLRAGSPVVGALVRFLGQASLSTRWNDTQNGFYRIGSDTGLRGYQIDDFTGQRLFNLQLEARSQPYPIWVLRLGAVAFYDLGGAANSLRTMALHQDAGLGLRILIPQTSAQLLKFDFAIPFDGPGQGKVRFIGGFGSEF
jgi:hypothetical protein